MDAALNQNRQGGSISRRGLLKLGAVAALVLGGAPAARLLTQGGSAAAPATELPATQVPTAGATVRSPRHLRLSTYEPLVGSSFVVQRPGTAPLRVTLASATALPSLGESFSLIFTARGNARLPQLTYTIQHPRLGSFPLFVVPVGSAGKGRSFQAIVNRLPASLMPRV